MTWKLVTNGSGASTLTTLPSYESSIAEGQRTRLDLSLSTQVPSEVLTTLQGQLTAQGVAEAQVAPTSSGVSVTWRKSFPWLAVIVAIILGIIVLAILIVSWQFFKEVAEVLPQPLIIGAVVIGLIFIVLLIFLIFRSMRGGT